MTIEDDDQYGNLQDLYAKSPSVVEEVDQLLFGSDEYLALVSEMLRLSALYLTTADPKIYEEYEAVVAEVNAWQREAREYVETIRMEGTPPQQYETNPPPPPDAGGPMHGRRSDSPKPPGKHPSQKNKDELL